LSQRGFGDALNVGVGFTRQRVVTHARRRVAPLFPSIYRGRYGH
jgi:hypothetical protein